MSSPCKLGPSHKVFHHHFPGVRGPQTFALSVAPSVYNSTARKFLRKGAEKQRRCRSGGRASWAPGSIVLVTPPRSREPAAFLGGGVLTVVSEQLSGLLRLYSFYPGGGRSFSSPVRLREKQVEKCAEHSSSLFWSPSFSSDSLGLSEPQCRCSGNTGPSCWCRT